MSELINNENRIQNQVYWILKAMVFISALLTSYTIKNDTLENSMWNQSATPRPRHTQRKGYLSIINKLILKLLKKLQVRA